MPERGSFTNKVIEFFKGSHRTGGESKPEAFITKSLVIDVGGKKTTLISAEKMAELHREALDEADRITEDRIRDMGGSLWWLGFVAECLITGGHPTALNPRKRR